MATTGTYIAIAVIITIIIIAVILIVIFLNRPFGNISGIPTRPVKLIAPGTGTLTVQTTAQSRDPSVSSQLGVFSTDLDLPTQFFILKSDPVGTNSKYVTLQSNLSGLYCRVVPGASSATTTSTSLSAPPGTTFFFDKSIVSSASADPLNWFEIIPSNTKSSTTTPSFSFRNLQYTNSYINFATTTVSSGGPEGNKQFTVATLSSTPLALVIA